MKVEIKNRMSYFDIESKKNYTNDTLCILNDLFKINILLLPKCGSTTIKSIIDYREKYYSDLNDDEMKYTKICFVRDIESRFFSGINTILRRNNEHTSKFFKYFHSKNMKTFVLSNLNEHLTSYEVLLNGIKPDLIFNLNTLNFLEIKKYKSMYTHEINKITNILKNENFLDDDDIQEYYKTDTLYFENSEKQLTENVYDMFKNYLN